MLDDKLEKLEKVTKRLEKSDAILNKIEQQNQQVSALFESRIDIPQEMHNIGKLIESNPVIQELEKQTNLIDIQFKELPITKIDSPNASAFSIEPNKTDLFESTPTLKVIAQQNRLENLTGLQRFVTTFSQVMNTAGKIGMDIINSPIVTGLGKAAIALERSQPAIMQFLNNFAQSPIVRFLEKLASAIPEQNQFHRLYLQTMYDARWFPYTGDERDVDPDYLANILEVIDSTRASKNRTKKIDKVVFSHYTKTRVEKIRKSWRDTDLPRWKIRILNQAVAAYHRKEYALTIDAMITFWEGLIQEKVNDPDYRVSFRTRQNLGKLIESNNFDNIVKSFCDEFILYDCRKPEQVKDDVPGRHGIAHTWFNKYPNQKTALNAILFTDFLLKLEPILDDEATQQ